MRNLARWFLFLCERIEIKSTRHCPLKALGESLNESSDVRLVSTDTASLRDPSIYVITIPIGFAFDSVRVPAAFSQQITPSFPSPKRTVSHLREPSRSLSRAPIRYDVWLTSARGSPPPHHTGGSAHAPQGDESQIEARCL